MRKAICPGSFDPVTRGHVDIIKRASKMFDCVIVAVMVNPSKTPSFTIEERVRFLKLATSELNNIEIVSFDGLLAEYAKEKEAVAIVKGLRAMSDFEYEFQMALANKKLNENLETVFFTTSAENMYLSSSMIKQISRFGGDISSFVPECIHKEIKDRLCERECKY